MSETNDRMPLVPITAETMSSGEQGPKTGQVLDALGGLTDPDGLLFQINDENFTQQHAPLLGLLTHANDAQAEKDGTAYEATTGVFIWDDESGATQTGNVLELMPQIVASGENIPADFLNREAAQAHINIIKTALVVHIRPAGNAEQILTYDEWVTQGKPQASFELDPNKLPDPERTPTGEAQAGTAETPDSSAKAPETDVTQEQLVNRGRKTIEDFREFVKAQNQGLRFLENQVKQDDFVQTIATFYPEAQTSGELTDEQCLQVTLRDNERMNRITRTLQNDPSFQNEPAVIEALQIEQERVQKENAVIYASLNEAETSVVTTAIGDEFTIGVLENPANQKELYKFYQMSSKNPEEYKVRVEQAFKNAGIDNLKNIMLKGGMVGGLLLFFVVSTMTSGEGQG